MVLVKTRRRSRRHSRKSFRLNAGMFGTRRRNPLRKRHSSHRRGSIHRPLLRFDTPTHFLTGPRSRLIHGYARINPRRRRHSRRNPFYSRRRHCRRNPFSMRSVINRSFLMTAGTVGISLVAGTMSMSLVSGIIPQDQRMKMDKFLGIVHVLIGTLMYTMLRNKNLKTAGLIFGGLGVYDLVVSNIEQIGLPPLPRTNSNITKLLPHSTASTTSTTSGMGASFSRPRAQRMLSASFEGGRSPVGLSGNPYEEIEF